LGGGRGRTHLLRVRAGDDSITVVTVANGVVEDAEFLGYEVDDSALLGGEGPGESEFVSHGIVLEEENSGIDFQRGGVVHVKLIWGLLRGGGGWGLGDCRERGLPRPGLSREGEGAGRAEWGDKVVVELVELGLLFLLELHGAHPANGLFALDALLFAGLQDLFVLDSESPALDVEAVEGSDDGIRIWGVAEVCKGEATEGACLVEVVVEGIGEGDTEGLLVG